ncbi:MAG: DegV family protein [Ruminococcaceae bacterium]|nr:DegV family protein [Oscillospiraceae bacterium]
MNNYIILTDSGTDFTPEMIKELDVELLDLTVTLEGQEPRANSELDLPALYAFLREKKSASTAAVNLDTFLEAMTPYLEDGKDILYLGFSSGLSSTFASGRLAAEELSEKYPDRKILVADTLCASLGQGLLVYHAAKLKQSGASIEEVRDFVEANKLKFCHWFTIDDLFFLKRGGRVSATTAVVGTMLGIKPVMHVDNEGHLINVGKARGRRASIDALFDKANETMIGDRSEAVVFISHGDCIEDAEYLADRIRKEIGVKEVRIGYVGAVIGSHSGPGTLALFFLGSQR